MPKFPTCNSSFFGFSMKQTLFLLLLLSQFLTQLVTLPSAVFANDGETVRLRLRWGGENLPAYGEVSCSAGPLQALTPISMDAESPGGAWLVNGSAQIRQSVPKKYNGFDVTVPYRPGAKIFVQIAEQSDFSAAKRVEIPLSELLAGNKTFQLSESSPSFQCSVNRVPGDSLRVELERDNLVFAPRDMFQCTVRPCIFRLENDSETSFNEAGELEYVVYRGRETFEVHRGLLTNVALNGMLPAQIQFPVPETEGCYDIVLKLRRQTESSGKDVLPNPFTNSRLNRKQVLAERRIQFIVVSDAAPAVHDAASRYALKLEIDPAQAKWWESFEKSTLRQFRSWFPEAASLQSTQRQIRSGGNRNFLELPQSQDPKTNPAWEAFPLIVESPGMPYVLEVEYLTNVEQTFSISIMEPNTAGAISPPGIDSGVNVPAPVGDPDAQAQAIRLDRHHIIFWPQSKTPVVLIVNRHLQKPACFGKIRLYAAGEHLASHPKFRLPENSLTPEPPQSSNWGQTTVLGQNLLLEDGLPRSSTPTLRPDQDAKRRLVAILIGKPMFAQAFSSSEMSSEPNGLCVSDWKTYYDGAARMIEYLNHVGFNGAFLTIYSDGSSIYPSHVLNPTPRSDNGIYFPTAQDPVRKDVVEMLFRMFDRKELTLIPSMDFSSPISELETAARFPGAQELRNRQVPPGSIRWINPFGKELTAEKDSLKNGAPYYDILNPFVQETVLRSIAEVARRYGHHPAFGGISLQLHANSFLVLPTPQWGMDAASIAEFARETGTALPGAYAQQVRYLSAGAGSRAWLSWRAGRMTLFFRRAAALLSSIPNARLYLNGTDLFNLEAHPELMPRLDGILTAENAFLYFGLDVQQLQTIPNLTISRPQKILTNHPLTEQAGDLQWAQTPGTYRIFQNQQEPSALFFHTPEILRLESFDQASPFKPTFTWMASTYAQTTAEARRPYAEALAMLDAFTFIEGGWNPVFGKEEALAGTIHILSQLPATHFSSAMSSAMNGPKNQPIIFRACFARNQNYAYAVNLTPFPMKGRVYVQPAMEANAHSADLTSLRVTRLEDHTSRTLTRDERGLFWEVQLAPYQIEAIRFEGTPVMLLDPACDVPPESLIVFQREFLHLQHCLQGLKTPTFYLGLKNPGFESVAVNAKALPGWEITRPALPAAEKNRAALASATPSVTPTGTPSPSQAVSAAEPELPLHPASVSDPAQALSGTPAAKSAPSTALLDPQNSIFGENALRLTSDGEPIRIMSHAFEVNPTGRLAIHFWSKTSADGISLPLRVIVEGQTPHGKFFRTANLSASAAAIGREWKRLSVYVNDLPLEKETRLSLGFELYGVGCVWIDNIQLSDTHFSAAELQQLNGIFSQFGNRIATGDLAPCVSTLECYWLRFLKENVAANVPPQSSPLASQPPASGTQQTPSFETVPTRSGPQLPHLGQLPSLPNLPKLPSPPKFQGTQPQTVSEKDFEKENKKNTPGTYFEKMKNLLPW